MNIIKEVDPVTGRWTDAYIDKILEPDDYLDRLPEV